jgi:hypothetical protein
MDHQECHKDAEGYVNKAGRRRNPYRGLISLCDNHGEGDCSEA